MRDRLTGPRRRQEAVQRWLPCWPSGDRGGKSGGRASRRGASEKQSSKGRSHSLSLAPAQSPLGPFHASSSAGALAHGRAPATAPAREQRRGPQRLKMLPFFLGRRSEKAASEATKCIQFFYPYLEHGGGSDDGDHLAGGGEGLADGSGEGRGLGGGAVEANELRELEGEASGRQRERRSKGKLAAAAASSAAFLCLSRTAQATHREAEVVRTERRVAFCMEACMVVLWRRGANKKKDAGKKRRSELELWLFSKISTWDLRGSPIFFPPPPLSAPRPLLLPLHNSRQ